MVGLVPNNSRTPSCPWCHSSTEFVQCKSQLFSWYYHCLNAWRVVSRAEARKHHQKSRMACVGKVTATANTWFADARSVNKAYSLLILLHGLLFCWLNRVSVIAAANKCSSKTAIDHYSMAREVCEVIMSHEVSQRKFGGPGVEVEVDKCFLSRRKYHKGRRLCTSPVTLFQIYEWGPVWGSTFKCATAARHVIVICNYSWSHTKRLCLRPVILIPAALYNSKCRKYK